MEAFLSSTFAVAIAEIGDKTQLLALLLATRFTQRGDRAAIIWGILLATLVNHGVSAWAGQWLRELIPAEWLTLLLAVSFIALGLWLLIPDKDEEVDKGFFKYGAFVASLVLFFLAEVGDKTQVATVVLAARFDNYLAVVMGTTIGMLVANVPVVYAGSWLMQRMPMAIVHKAACALFILLGVFTLVGYYWW
ncbi:TMEM165/GDT1 family protein [Idiomarina xiamenensis]|uniref:GDT1 family protein n=1 Tax=Idiomarina xiamenensis 10-D-4 TaxID=740709 RepID=K2L221_9GAMM|nr:TMEM165/GDT1 family protein [Idiomarina xiamenensis]EKE83895.1 hypothetical protein A10D4_07106 [Idiomarina xiamenensis 10-D-4]